MTTELTIIVDVQTETAHIHRAGCADVARTMPQNAARGGFTERFSGTVAELLPQMDTLLDGDDLGWRYRAHILPCAHSVTRVDPTNGISDYYEGK